MAINGFSTCNPSVLGIYKVPGTRRSLQVRREIAPLLVGFAAEFHRLVEPIDGKLDDWGYACRKVRFRNTVSFHSAGLAIDLNAVRHPLGTTGTFSAKQASIIRALCRKYGLRWGGDYRGRKDFMHVEVILPRGAALALVKRLQTHTATSSAGKAALKLATKPVTGLSGAFPLHAGAFGIMGRDWSGNENAVSRAGVVQIERALNYTMKTKFALDGKYRKDTATWVALFQKKYGLPVTGRVDKATWTMLDRRTP